MIQTVPFDVIVGFGAGAAMVEIARQPLVEVDDALRNRYFAVVLMFACGSLMPAGLVFYVQHPDWSLMYLANPTHLPQAFMLPLVMFLYTVSPAFGFAAAHTCLKSRRKNALEILLGLTAVVLLALLVWGWDRLFTVAYYNDYHYQGATLSLLSSKLVWMVAAISIIVTSVYGYCVYLVRGHIAQLNRTDAVEEDVRAKMAAESPTLPPH